MLQAQEKHPQTLQLWTQRLNHHLPHGALFAKQGARLLMNPGQLPHMHKPSHLLSIPWASGSKYPNVTHVLSMFQRKKKQKVHNLYYPGTPIPGCVCARPPMSCRSRASRTTTAQGIPGSWCSHEQVLVFQSFWPSSLEQLRQFEQVEFQQAHLQPEWSHPELGYYLRCMAERNLSWVVSFGKYPLRSMPNPVQTLPPNKTHLTSSGV